MTLEEWDKKVGPLLGAIKGRSVWIRVDANQILEWIKGLPAAPDFETEAMSVLREAQEALAIASASIQEAIVKYESKEKTT